MTSFKATVEDQTYEIDCGEDGKYPVGSKVRVRLEDTDKPLEIAEIYAYGELGWSSTFDTICQRQPKITSLEACQICNCQSPSKAYFEFVFRDISCTYYFLSDQKIY